MNRAVTLAVSALALALAFPGARADEAPPPAPPSLGDADSDAMLQAMQKKADALKAQWEKEGLTLEAIDRRLREAMAADMLQLRQKLAARGVAVHPLSAPEQVPGVPLARPVTVDLLYTGHVLIPAELEGQAGYFVLDTGSPSNVLNPGFSRGTFEPRGVLIGGEACKVSFDPWHQDITRILAERCPGVTCLGMLGHPFLKDYAFRIDFRAWKVSLLPGPQALPDAGSLGADHVLLDCDIRPDGKVLIRDGQVGESLTGPLHYDTGAPTFSIDPGEASAVGGKAFDVRAGALRWSGILPSLRDFRQAVSQTLVGEFGMDLLLDATVTLHYADRKLEIARDPSIRRVPRRDVSQPGDLIGLAMDRKTNRIQKVKEGTLGQALGLKPGDRILAVNAKAVLWPQFMDALLRLRNGEAVTISVEREGKPLDLKGTY